MLKHRSGTLGVLFILMLLSCPHSFAAENASCQIPPGQEGLNQAEDNPGSQNPALKVYTLNNALTQALAHNKYILAAKEDILSARAGKSSAFGAMLPHAYVAMDAMNQEGLKDKELNADYMTQAQNYRRLGVRQTIFDMPTFGRYDGAALQEERSKLYLQQTQLEILYTTEKEFFELLSSKENVKSYEKAVERMEQQVRSAKAFYEKQMKPRLHVLQMQTQLAKEQSRLSSAKNKVKIQQAKLVSILSLPQDTPVAFTGSLEDIQVCNLERLSTYIDMAFETRPDILIRKKEIEISKQGESIIEGKYYPTVAAFIEYNQKDIDYGKDRYADANHETYSVGLNFRWDFFEGTSTHYSLQEQKRKTQSTNLKYQKIKENVATQVKQSYLDVIQYKAQIELSRTYAKEAQETYSRADKRYKLGIGTSTELVDASRELIDAEVSLNTALAAYNSSLAALYYSSGGYQRLRELGEDN